MAKTRVRTVEIDPRFFAPPGVIDIRQENKENGEFAYDGEDDSAVSVTLESPEAVVPMVTDGVKIVEQRIRIAADGRSVVDVTIEIPDRPEIKDVNVRYTAP